MPCLALPSIVTSIDIVKIEKGKHGVYHADLDVDCDYFEEGGTTNKVIFSSLLQHALITTIDATNRWTVISELLFMAKGWIYVIQTDDVVQGFL